MSDEEVRYSMDEVAQEAGISYGTLSVFIRKHGDRIPSAMSGCGRETAGTSALSAFFPTLGRAPGL